MAVIQKQIVFINNYTESVNQNNELHVTGTYQTHQIDQTITVPTPCLLMLDSTNGNLVAIPIANYDPNLKLVKIIESIETVVVPQGA